MTRHEYNHYQCKLQINQLTLDVASMTEMKYCPICHKEVEVEYVTKPDADLKVCKNCGAAVSIRYNDH
jgi:hypothetical protein